MKDQRVYIKIESEKKDSFFKAAKSLKSNSTEILTKKIDEVILLHQNKGLSKSQADKDFKERYFNV